MIKYIAGLIFATIFGALGYFSLKSIVVAGWTMVVAFYLYVAIFRKSILVNYKPKMWALFIAPQVCAVAAGALSEQNIYDLYENSILWGEGSPYIGLRRALAYLGALSLHERSVSLIASAEFALMATALCIPNALLWALYSYKDPSAKSFSSESICGLMLVLVVLIAFYLCFPFASSAGCVQKCSNIATSNFPRLIGFLYVQSLVVGYIACMIKAIRQIKNEF